jgi:hypothetical protein
MSRSEWDDLFALAEGVQENRTHELGPGTEEAEPTASSAARTTKKARRSTPHSSTAFLDYLADRSTFKTQLPSGLEYGKSLISDDCVGPDFPVYDGGTCGHCHGKSFRHHIRPTAQADAATLFLFCHLRNLRHVAFLAAQEANTHISFDVVLKEWHKLKGSRAALNQQEEHIRSSVWKLMKRISAQRKRPNMTHDAVVRIIIDCDSIYYDLYYLEITSKPTRRHFVPHPSYYFGESLEELSQAMQLCQNQSTQVCNPSLNDRFHLDCNAAEEDPLTALHRARFLETLQLFNPSKKLGSRQDLREEFLRAARSQEGSKTIHETPAPLLLRDWRNSCRDFLTHLYAYATLPRTTVTRIQSFVDNQRVVEVGAGTGYLTKLLQDDGLSVDAFDVRPGQENEYHGSTPTFVAIQPGNASRVVTKQKQPFVLLLCYAPPDSSMAYDTLRSFVKAGGERLVHVGEFRGLTGTREFEDLLQSRFTCVSEHIPCPTWSTDASSVTFWTKSHRDDVQAILLPCVVCGKEAGKRFRLVRHLHYCNADCWNQHVESSLGDHLRLASVHLDPQGVSFEDKNAFLNL